MIASSQQTSLEKKRVLRKVRTNFLSKQPEDEVHDLVEVPKPLNPYAMCMISGAWAVVEQNRQILMGIKYLNSCLDIKNVKIQECGNSRQVILRPQISNQACLMPWEYSVKRLESYGDLEMATFAHKIKELNGNYERLIDKYQSMRNSDSRETVEEMEKAKINVKNWREKIESTYPYTVMTFHYDKSGVNLHSVAFDETILKEIGQSVGEFASWAESNGIPILFNRGAKIALSAGKRMLNQRISAVPEVDEKPELPALICDINGAERKVVIQQIQISEPTEHGFVISWYVIVKNSKTQETERSPIEDKINGKLNEPGLKWVKHEMSEMQTE